MSSNYHSSYHPAVMPNVYISRLEHISFNFITPIPHLNFVVVLVSPARWVHWSPWPVLNSQHFLLLRVLSNRFLHFLPQQRGFFNFFKAVFTIAGNLRLSILFFKRPAIILQTTKLYRLKCRQFLQMFPQRLPFRIGNEILKEICELHIH